VIDALNERSDLIKIIRFLKKMFQHWWQLLFKQTNSIYTVLLNDLAAPDFSPYPDS